MLLPWPRPWAGAPGALDEDNAALRRERARLIQIGQKLGGAGPTDLTVFLKTVRDPDAFVDIAAFNLCQDPPLKQRLLETLDVNRRLRLLHAARP